MRNIKFVWLCAILFCSCDILLPRPIKDAEQDYYESAQSEDEGMEYSQEYYEPNLTVDETDAIAFLTEFYNLYINCRIYGSPSSVYEKYLSDDLLSAFEYFKNYTRETGYLVLDSDPFIDAQDIVGSLRDGEFVIRRTSENNCYEMCYDDTCVKLYVTLINGEYKIADIGNDFAGTICRLHHNMLYSY